MKQIELGNKYADHLINEQVTKIKEKMMLIFRKECEHCKIKINKGEEIFRTVEDQVFIGTSQKAFCCSEHADGFEKYMKNLKRCSSCCR